MRAFLLSVLSLFLASTSAFAQASIDQKINSFFEPITKVVADIVFYSFPITIAGITTEVPFIIVWLISGAILFTIYFDFINIKRFKLAIDVVRGKLESKDEKGEVSHFQALTAALSGTVGLGNIAGVAVAISLGGPGATFWMIAAGLLGMSSKFAECTLGVKYRKIDEHGVVHGGPMYYLKLGLASKNMKVFGVILSTFFAIACVFGSFGGGNMFQANQAFQQFSHLDGVEGTWIAQNGWFFGLVMASVVAIVIIGGIKSIANVTDKIVPFMCGLYVVCALFILAVNYASIPHAFYVIMKGAFTPGATVGGIVGVLITGFKRAAFSNEAGVGSASIAHSAVKTNYPASEGIVSLLEPFIDTVIICTMTALVLVITGYYQRTDLTGIELTSSAFATSIPFAHEIILLVVVLFAFSTMISWSYYGLQAWLFLFGNKKIHEYIYKLLFCAFVVVGSTLSLGAVVDFSDCMILAMCFPNIIGLIILLPTIKQELNAYLEYIRNISQK